MEFEGRVGPLITADGSIQIIRLTRDGAQSVVNSHARYMESVMRGGVFSVSTASAGVTVVAANNSPLGAAGTPLVGAFNPANSGKALVILRCVVAQISGTPPAVPGFYWNVIANPAGITAAGSAPLNMYTLNANGSVARGFVNAAITGSVAATLYRPINAAQVAAAPAAIAGSNVLGAYMEETAGEIVVPPGGFAGIAAGTAAGTTWVVFAAMTWEEVPL